MRHLARFVLTVSAFALLGANLDICPIGWMPPDCQRQCVLGFFGNNCASPCPATCTNNSCQPDSGFCFRCQLGFSGDNCSFKCPQGLFGQDCNNKCPVNCFKRQCDPFTGQCERCVPGYEGKLCEIHYSVRNKNKQSATPGGNMLVHRANMLNTPKIRVLFAVTGTVSSVMFVCSVLLCIYILQMKIRQEGVNIVQPDNLPIYTKLNRDQRKSMSRDKLLIHRKLSRYSFKFPCCPSGQVQEYHQMQKMGEESGTTERENVQKLPLPRKNKLAVTPPEESVDILELSQILRNNAPLSLNNAANYSHNLYFKTYLRKENSSSGLSGQIHDINEEKALRNSVLPRYNASITDIDHNGGEVDQTIFRVIDENNKQSSIVAKNRRLNSESGGNIFTTSSTDLKTKSNPFLNTSEKPGEKNQGEIDQNARCEQPVPHPSSNYKVGKIGDRPMSKDCVILKVPPAMKIHQPDNIKHSRTGIHENMHQVYAETTEPLMKSHVFRRVITTLNRLLGRKKITCSREDEASVSVNHTVDVRKLDNLHEPQSDISCIPQNDLILQEGLEHRAIDLYGVRSERPVEKIRNISLAWKDEDLEPSLVGSYQGKSVLSGSRSSLAVQLTNCDSSYDWTKKRMSLTPSFSHIIENDECNTVCMSDDQLGHVYTLGFNQTGTSGLNAEEYNDKLDDLWSTSVSESMDASVELNYNARHKYRLYGHQPSSTVIDDSNLINESLYINDTANNPDYCCTVNSFCVTQPKRHFQEENVLLKEPTYRSKVSNVSNDQEELIPIPLFSIRSASQQIDCYHNPRKRKDCGTYCRMETQRTSDKAKLINTNLHQLSNASLNLDNKIASSVNLATTEFTQPISISNIVNDNTCTNVPINSHESSSRLLNELHRRIKRKCFKTTSYDQTLTTDISLPPSYSALAENTLKTFVVESEGPLTVDQTSCKVLHTPTEHDEKGCQNTSLHDASLVDENPQGSNVGSDLGDSVTLIPKSVITMTVKKNPNREVKSIYTNNLELGVYKQQSGVKNQEQEKYEKEIVSPMALSVSSTNKRLKKVVWSIETHDETNDTDQTSKQGEEDIDTGTSPTKDQHKASSQKQLDYRCIKQSERGDEDNSVSKNIGNKHKITAINQSQNLVTGSVSQSKELPPAVVVGNTSKYIHTYSKRCYDFRKSITATGTSFSHRKWKHIILPPLLEELSSKEHLISTTEDKASKEPMQSETSVSDFESPSNEKVPVERESKTNKITSYWQNKSTGNSSIFVKSGDSSLITDSSSDYIKMSEDSRLTDEVDGEFMESKTNSTFDGEFMESKTNSTFDGESMTFKRDSNIFSQLSSTFNSDNPYGLQMIELSGTEGRSSVSPSTSGTEGRTSLSASTWSMQTSSQYYTDKGGTSERFYDARENAFLKPHMFQIRQSGRKKCVLTTKNNENQCSDFEKVSPTRDEAEHTKDTQGVCIKFDICQDTRRQKLASTKHEVNTAFRFAPRNKHEETKILKDTGMHMENNARFPEAKMDAPVGKIPKLRNNTLWSTFIRDPLGRRLHDYFNKTYHEVRNIGVNTSNNDLNEAFSKQTHRLCDDIVKTEYHKNEGVINVEGNTPEKDLIETNTEQAMKDTSAGSEKYETCFDFSEW